MFVADYVLMGYGTGAIMAVPGQDERDWEFATRFGLPIVRTVQPPDGLGGRGVHRRRPGDQLRQRRRSAWTGWTSTRRRPGSSTGWSRQGTGRRTITYKLRDWLFSRQRYWGEPFPIVYDEHDLPVALPDSMLPVELPEVDDYSPKTFAEDDTHSEPEPPLARKTDWVEVTLDLGDGPKPYRRETNTMPQWAGSCWYELRYLDPTNNERFVDPEVERYWMGPQGDGHTGGVDLYVGGAEHAVLHLLYARFWHKVLFDLGHVSSSEPFHRLFNQGMIQAFAYTDERGGYVPAADVVPARSWTVSSCSRTRASRSPASTAKIGKSLKNMVTPDEMYDAYGADTFRLYEMSMGPLDVSRPWETRAVVGSQRFLQRLWRNVIDEETGELRVVEEPADEETRRLLHRTIDGVRDDLDGLRFNTAIARLIELNNHVVKAGVMHRETAEALVLMVAPLAPHIAEELWSRLGHPETLTYEPFPVADPALLVVEQVTCVLQVGGQGARPHPGPAVDRRGRAARAGAGLRGGAEGAGRPRRAHRGGPRAQAGQRRTGVGAGRALGSLSPCPRTPASPSSPTRPATCRPSWCASTASRSCRCRSSSAARRTTRAPARRPAWSPRRCARGSR